MAGEITLADLEYGLHMEKAVAETAIQKALRETKAVRAEAIGKFVEFAKIAMKNYANLSRREGALNAEQLAEYLPLVQAFRGVELKEGEEEEKGEEEEGGGN